MNPLKPYPLGVPSIPLAARFADNAFFNEYPDRRLRIRNPIDDEYREEFESLGLHQMSRRKILMMKLPRQIARSTGIDIMRIPFLPRADETIEDRDDILGPIFDELMKAETKRL